MCSEPWGAFGSKTAIFQEGTVPFLSVINDVDIFYSAYAYSHTAPRAGEAGIHEGIASFPDNWAGGQEP